jgi:hypothetical protein
MKFPFFKKESREQKPDKEPKKSGEEFLKERLKRDIRNLGGFEYFGFLVGCAGAITGSYTFLRIAEIIAEKFHKGNFSIEAFLAECVPIAVTFSSLPFIYLGFQGIKTRIEDMLSEKLRRKRGD